MGLIHNVTFQFDSESSYGTGAGSYTYMPIRSDADPPTISVPQFKRDYYMGGNAQAASIPGAATYSKKFQCWLRGSGIAGTAPELRKLLLCCGLDETVDASYVDYHPSESSFGSASIKYNLDGTEYPITGARASTWTVTFKGGEPVTFEADIQGRAATTSQVSIAAPTYLYAYDAPVAQAMALTINSVTHVVPEIKATCNLNTQWIPDVNGTNGQGVYTPGRREVIIEATIVRDTSADTEWYTALLAGTEYAISSTGVGSAGNRIGIYADKAQLIELAPAEMNETVVYKAKFQCNYDSTSYSTQKEFRIRFS